VKQPSVAAAPSIHSDVATPVEGKREGEPRYVYFERKEKAEGEGRGKGRSCNTREATTPATTFGLKRKGVGDLKRPILGGEMKKDLT